MCGCTSTKGYAGNSTACSGKIKDLQKIRNDLITLEKLVDVEKRVEYKEVRTQVEVLLKEASTTCPDASVVISIREYVDNEYAINNN